MAKYCSSKMVGMDHEGIAKSIVKKRMMNKGGMVESDEDEGFLDNDMPETEYEDDMFPGQEEDVPNQRKKMLEGIMGSIRSKHIGRK